MKHNIWRISIIIFTLLLTACTGVVIEPSPEPTLELIDLQITPELAHWLPWVSQCAQSIDSIGIYTEIRTQESLDIDQTDLVLKLGQRDESDPYVAVMGYEELVPVGGREVPIDTISIESLQGIFRGSITNWGDLPEVIDQGIEINQPIQTLSYPQGHILQQRFSQSYLNSEPVQTEPILYSTVEGLSEKLREYPYSIAFLLKSHTNKDLKMISITGIETEAAQQYVLAVTKTEPQGRLKQLLLCLQNMQGSPISQP
ncbi:MAG TPA: hypothetical protein VIM80_05660 [Brevefilum sp.]